jgi:hypothetical protein
MKKLVRSIVVVMLVLAFSISIAGTQTARAASFTTTQVSEGWLPFAGSLYDSQTNSRISFNGWVHIVASVTPLSSSQWQVNLHANLPTGGLLATTDTGIPYLAYGAGQSSGIFSPGDPYIPGDPYRLVLPSFVTVAVPPNPFIPTDPYKPVGFGLKFSLVFSAKGVLNFSASTVQVIDLVAIGPG